ncbi:hypothetical protein GCK72_000362 [Caenorhabditis remanei]|uniref:Uncharacterized protein n=1 Tax=Caenorhabditis remanei TaxID=31234 RepID=A0A6A5HK43_CAERE|nr:hypothetical protein GCK72_000362 [Caenorhabditis remanei]KAF1768550.1 hypothetical protein GCK72_000362 [Caenorhabditis remanei]
MSTRCVEYGPLRFQVLKEIKKPIHYKKLHISDKLLEIVANHCTLRSTTKEKCFEKLNNIIRSTISCDTLLLWICEIKEHYVNGVRENAHFSMPREVLDVMIRTWNVKTIRMNMIVRTKEDICCEKWINKGYFTKIKLDDPYWKTGRSSDLKLKHVSVKVTDSYDCAGGLIYSIPKTGYQKSFENYIANLRRLFQMDKLSIDFSHWAHKYSASLEEFMRNILRVIQLEKQRKLEVNIQFFTEISSFKVGNSEKLAEIPSEYSLLSDRVECNRMFVPFDVADSGPERLNMIKWVGRRFQVKDVDNHFTLNLNIYVKEIELTKMDKGLMETHPNSLIGVFFPQKPLEISRKLMAKRLVAKCPGAESIKIGLQSNVNDTIESSSSFKNSPQTTTAQKPKPLQQLMTSTGADQIQNHSFSTKATASPHPSYLPMLQDVQQILDSSAILLDAQHEAAANVKKMQAKMSQIRDALSPLFKRMESSAALFEDILEKMGSSSPLADRIKQMKLASSSLLNASYSPIFKFSSNVVEVEKLQNEVDELRNELEKERVRGDLKSREAAQNFEDLEVRQATLNKVETEKAELMNEVSRLEDSHRRLVAELDEAKRQMEKTLVRCAAEQDARLNAEKILEETKQSVEVLKREQANAMMIEVDYRVTEAKELVEREKKAIIESLSSELQTALAEEIATRNHLERMEHEMELLRRRARDAQDRLERTANEKHEMVILTASLEEKMEKAAAFEKEATDYAGKLAARKKEIEVSKKREDMVNAAIEGLERVRKEVVELTKKTLKTQIILGNASSIRLVCDELCRRLTRERELQNESAETMKYVNDNIEQLQKENLEMQAKIRESQGVSKKSSTSNNKENAPPRVASSEAPITAPPSSSQKTSTTTSNFVSPTRQLLHESTMAVDSIVQKLKKTYTMSGMGAELKETIGNLIIESRGLRDFLHQKLILFKGIDMTMWKNDSVDQLVEKLGQYLQDNLILEEQIKKYKKELKLTKTVIPNLGADVQERIKREICGIASDLGAVKTLLNKKLFFVTRNLINCRAQLSELCDDENESLDANGKKPKISSVGALMCLNALSLEDTVMGAEPKEAEPVQGDEPIQEEEPIQEAEPILGAEPEEKAIREEEEPKGAERIQEEEPIQAKNSNKFLYSLKIFFRTLRSPHSPYPLASSTPQSPSSEQQVSQHSRRIPSQTPRLSPSSPQVTQCVRPSRASHWQSVPLDPLPLEHVF